MRRTTCTPPSISGRIVSARAEPAQLGGAFARCGARNHVERRREAARGGDDDLRTCLVWDSNDEGAGVVQARVRQDLRVTGIAEQRVDACCTKRFGNRGVRFDNQAGNAEPHEKFGYMAADASPADDHDVITQVPGFGHHVGAAAVDPAPEPGPPPQKTLRGFDRPEHQRVHGDGHHRAGENQPVLGLLQQAEGKTRLAHDERELADLAQAGSHDQAGARGARKGEGRDAAITALPTTTRRELKHFDPVRSRGSAGLTSMPTDTKNSTANASRKGSRSAPTWWLYGDSLTTTPATKAPSASDTPNANADTSAVPSATLARPG